MTTPLDALAEALRDCRKYASGAEALPEAILWCDPGGEFAPVLPALRVRLSQLLSFGAYDPVTRSGPALWLRAASARQVAGIEWPADEPAIIYLPELGREVLRGVEDCPAELAPLVWFAVAGTFFGQPRQARDWSLRGFLAAQGSPINLDIPDDKATREALGRAARQLFAEPIETLKGRRLDAAALDALLVPDLDSDMLRWIDGTLTPDTDPERFTAFAALAAKQLGFNPRRRSRQEAAARLAQREKRWAKVWDRFEDRYGAYEGVVNLLREEAPQSMFEGRDAYPSVNLAAENKLRSALLSLESMAQDKAAVLLELDARHGWRRETVWARRSEARLAQALEHLAAVAGAPVLPSHDMQALADAYLGEGWKVDWAAMRALDIARTGADREAVTTALRVVYLPWLDGGAVALQKLAAESNATFAAPAKMPPPSSRAALLFVDGLRMDLAQRLTAQLRAKGATVKVGSTWSGFPTATATCKPLASPAALLLAAPSTDDLVPCYEGKPTQKPILLKAIEAAGWCTSESLLGGEPLWLEIGRFDERGHVLGADLATQAHDLLNELVETVLRLARQGRRVRIVTDHGWLLMPGGLPYAPLVAGLTVAGGKGHRVATLKEGVPTTYPRFPWSWDKSVMLAAPTGARVFYSGIEYAHSGVSPQECILPVLDVTAETETAPVVIKPIWRRLRLNVEVPGGAGLMLDVRLGSDSSGESILPRGARQLDDLGQVGVLIPDEYEGKQVCLVVHPPNAPQDLRARLIAIVEG